MEKKVIDLDTNVATHHRRYLYDGWNVVAELNVEPSTLNLEHVRTYTWGLDVTTSLTGAGGVGALLQIEDHSANKTLFATYDGNGNVSALVNAASGSLEAVYEYSPFGELLRAEGAYAKSNPYRFSSKFQDDETGLVYYGHRYYSTELGRFINRDPIAETGGLNLYGFCGNDGLNRWDYLGWASPRWKKKGGWSMLGVKAKKKRGSSVVRGSGQYDDSYSLRKKDTADKDSDATDWGDIDSVSYDLGSDHVRDGSGYDMGPRTDASLYTTGQIIEAKYNSVGLTSQLWMPGDAIVATYNPKTGLTTTSLYSPNAFTPNGQNGVHDSIIDNDVWGAGSLVSSVLDLFGKIWNLPNTVIGVTVGLIGYGVGKIMGTDPGISFGHNGIEFTNNPAMFLGGAITLGNAIIYAGNAYRDQYGIPAGSTPAGDGPHEQQHTYQGQALGPAYLPAAGLSLLLGTLLDGDSHGPHSFMEKGPQMTPPQPWP